MTVAGTDEFIVCLKAPRRVHWKCLGILSTVGRHNFLWGGAKSFPLPPPLKVGPLKSSYGSGGVLYAPPAGSIDFDAF